MSHELVKLTQKIYDTPHYAHPSTFAAVMRYLKARNETDHFEPEARVIEDSDGNYTFNSDSGVAVMNISGPLTYAPYVTLCGEGGANYQTIKEDFAELVDKGAHTVVLQIDSGGGEAYQCFATARYMRELADANGVKIISFVDGLAASAAYGLAVSADEIIVAEGSEVGSIGVLVRLMNDTKALEKEGYERSYVSAGKEKIPFAADGSFRPEFIQDIQSKVDTLYSEFTGFVSTRRNLSVEAVVATEAKTFLPEQALQLGLIDKVMTIEGFYDYLADVSVSQKTTERKAGGNATKLTTQLNEETLNMDKIAELEAAVAAAQALAEGKDVELSSLTSANAALVADLAKANEQLATLQGELANNKTATRLATLKQYLAEDQAGAVNASLANADDAVFQTIVTGYKAQSEKLKASELFSELGEMTTEELNTDNTNAVLEATRKQLNNTK